MERVSFTDLRDSAHVTNRWIMLLTEIASEVTRISQMVKFSLKNSKMLSLASNVVVVSLCLLEERDRVHVLNQKALVLHCALHKTLTPSTVQLWEINLGHFSNRTKQCWLNRSEKIYAASTSIAWRTSLKRKAKCYAKKFHSFSSTTSIKHLLLSWSSRWQVSMWNRTFWIQTT